jgi:hypothetical protein
MIAIPAGSQPAAPTLASVRSIHQQSRHQSPRATRRSLVHADACPQAWSQTVHRNRPCPSSQRPSPRQNPHSARGTTSPHLPRFRALALFGRRPPQRVAGIVCAGVRKPAQSRTLAADSIAGRGVSGGAFIQCRLFAACHATEQLHQVLNLDAFEQTHGILDLLA